MTRRRWPDQLAAIALGVAVIVLTWAIVDAVRLTPAADRLPPGVEPSRTSTNARGSADTIVRPDIGVAVSRNVFSPSRRAPRVAFRLSTTDPIVDMAMERSTRERIDPLVLGTALGMNGASFAMCSYDDGPAEVVRVGDTLGPYTVVAIARGRVVFRDVDGTRLEVESPTSPDGDQP